MQIFQYCENYNLWVINQPLNILSNLAFLVCAYLIHRRYTLPAIGRLALVTLCIGVGSIVWHSSEQYYGLVLDIIPIIIWVIMLLRIIYTNIYALSRHASTIWIIAFLILSVVTGITLEAIMPQMTGAFLPIAILAIVVGSKSGARAFYAAGAALGVAMVMRIIDMDICQQLPIGTHWLWHVFCAVAIYYATIGCSKIRHQR